MGDGTGAAVAEVVPALKDRGADAHSENAGSGARASRVGYAPIVRVDAARREIELCATSEALDAHGTIFDYDASKDAFTRWIGNVREMHERRAVGQRVEVRCDDETRRIYVRARISRGAQDTWEKVLDGTLRGASIGASNVVWRRERRSLGGRARAVNVAARYDLAELSLVDNPSNPDALGVTIVRDAEPDLAALDRLDGEDSAQPFGPHAAVAAAAAVATEGVPALKGRGTETIAERASDAPDETGDGGTDSSQPDATRATRQTLHDAARGILAGCGCALCGLALATLEPGEPTPYHLSHGERESDAGDGVMVAALRACASGLARLDEGLRTLAADRNTERSGSGSASVTAGAEAEVAALRARVERLEAQPLPGGPAARAVEKTLATPLDGYGPAPASAQSITALEALAGRLRDPQAQMAVAAEMIRLQQGQE
ncbi:MAG TPA: hypothetical protein VFQ25_04735 [Ktedonobacterales bacterium]|nr:hypothetical protein [Ktedonobacterales bacterium]